MTILSAFLCVPILKAISAVERKGSGLARLVLNVETVECMSWVCMVCWSKLCCEILLLVLNMANMDCLLCRRLYIVQCSFSGCE